MANYAVIPAALAIALGVSLFSDPCRAQSAVSEGHALAQKTCAVCHVVVLNGPGSWTDAPSFESIANRPGMTQQWLADFVRKPHKDMVTDQYTPAQANAIAMYILSLRHQ
jgi:mono/diheme cytochrome c family protein